jgi:hypothetical protein
MRKKGISTKEKTVKETHLPTGTSLKKQKKKERLDY